MPSSNSCIRSQYSFRRKFRAGRIRERLPLTGAAVAGTPPSARTAPRPYDAGDLADSLHANSAGYAKIGARLHAQAGSLGLFNWAAGSTLLIRFHASYDKKYAFLLLNGSN
jgi:hypothetical protein